MRRLPILLAGLVIASSASAQINKCVDANHHVLYTSMPCTGVGVHQAGSITADLAPTPSVSASAASAADDAASGADAATSQQKQCASIAKDIVSMKQAITAEADRRTEQRKLAADYLQATKDAPPSSVDNPASTLAATEHAVDTNIRTANRNIEDLVSRAAQLKCTDPGSASASIAAH